MALYEDASARIPVCALDEPSFKTAPPSMEDVSRPRGPSNLHIHNAETKARDGGGGGGELAGKPLRIRGEGGTDAVRIADYGFHSFASAMVPVDMTFSVWFRQGRVVSVEDPFNGVFSTNGEPSSQSS